MNSFGRKPFFAPFATQAGKGAHWLTCLVDGVAYVFEHLVSAHCRCDALQPIVQRVDLMRCRRDRGRPGRG